MPSTIGLTSNLLPRGSKAAAVGMHPIICPGCQKATPQALNSAHYAQAFTCQYCKLKFVSVLAAVRSKHSHYANRSYGPRDISVRVRLVEGGEHEYLFRSKTGVDLDMHANDVAIFTLLKDHMRVVQNLTIGKYLILAAPSSNRSLWIVLAVLLVLLVVSLLVAAAFGAGLF